MSSSTREVIRAELERATLAADDAHRDELAKYHAQREPRARAAQWLRVQAAAAEHQRCLEALFATEPGNSRGKS